MNLKQKLGSLLLLAFLCLSASAQTNGCNSSYSRYGLGELNDQSQGFNRAMGGVAQGLRSGTMVNMLNPASYSAIDSLTFIFDVGMGMQYGHFTSGSNSVNARNTNLEYVNAGFHVGKGLGMSFGFVPYSTIGFNFTEDSRVGSSYTSTQAITTQTTYYGNGGIHQMYIGLGWNPVHNLSIGANVSYLWGDYNNSLAQVFYEGGTSNSNFSTMNQEVESDVKTYKVDLGLQYPIRINKTDQLTIGLSASLGHTVNSKITLNRYTSVGDTLYSEVSKAFSLPYTYGGGLSYKHKDQFIIAADYYQEHWSGCKVPVANDMAELTASTNEYLNRHRFVVGAEFTKDPMSRKYGDRIHYKVGANYTTPYVKVNGHDGPTEYGVTAGVALPLTTSSKSLVNVSLQWLRRTPSVTSMITENYFMLHLGVTVNERWFMKWKFN